MLADAHMSDHDVSVVRAAVVDADASTTWDAVLTTDLRDPWMRPLLEARLLPMRLRARFGGEPVPPDDQGPITFRRLGETGAWVVLDESPGEELVAGAVGRFWNPFDFGWRQVSAEAFAGFREPGCAKTLISLRVRPADEGRTVLTYESRTTTTDAEARRKFALYWRVISPGVRFIMGRAVHLVKREAERRVKGESLRRDLEPPPRRGRPARA